jgi:autotransporter-associated beta strand protein/YVTN family beta-propeller protein
LIDTTTNTATALPIANRTQGLALTANGRYAYMPNIFNSTVVVLDTTTNLVVATIPLASASYVFGNSLSPNLIVGTVSVTNEPALTSLGFGQFVDFQPGTLQTAAGLNDTHTLSLLTEGTIDTNGFDSTFSGNVIGVGTLIKAGAGTLTLSGTNTYMGGTTASGGVLIFAPSRGQADREQSHHRRHGNPWWPYWLLRTKASILSAARSSNGPPKSQPSIFAR